MHQGKMSMELYAIQNKITTYDAFAFSVVRSNYNTKFLSSNMHVKNILIFFIYFKSIIIRSNEKERRKSGAISVR